MPVRHLFLLVLLCANGLPRSRAQAVVGEVFAADANLRGSVLLTAGGTQVMSGSSITAGTAAARLKLARGGEVRICPGTQLGVNASPSGRELMLSLSSGSLEADYPLSASADSIVTPDFRLLLAGPGDFHLALAADTKGNTCVRALPGTTAAVIVTEQIGDGAYQLRPGDEVIFRAGKVSQRETVAMPCGCPPPPPLTIAEAKPAPLSEPVAIAEPAPSRAPVLPHPEVLPPAAPPPADGIHVQVDAPFVFRADEPPDPLLMASVRLERPSALNMWPAISPPPWPPAAPGAVTGAEERPKKKKRGWFRSFIAAVFGG